MKKEYLTYTPVVCVLALLCCTLWGSAFPCIKIGYRLLDISGEDTAAQILFAGIRFTLAGIITVLLGSITSKKVLVPKKESLFPIFKLSMVQTVMQYVFFYVGLAHTTGVKSSIINASNVFISIFLAVFIFRYEKLTPMKILGCILGFAGVVIVNLSGGQFDFSFSFAGEGAIFICAIAYGLSSGLIKKYSENENPVILSGYQFFIGGIIMALAGFISGGRISGFTAQSVLLILYLACVSAVGYTIWGILLKYNDIGKVAVFGFANPLSGVILSAIFLNEQTQTSAAYIVLSVILVSAGIFFVNKKTKTADA